MSCNLESLHDQNYVLHLFLLPPQTFESARHWGENIPIKLFTQCGKWFKHPSSLSPPPSLTLFKLQTLYQISHWWYRFGIFYSILRLSLDHVSEDSMSLITHKFNQAEVPFSAWVDCPLSSCYQFPWLFLPLSYSEFDGQAGCLICDLMVRGKRSTLFYRAKGKMCSKTSKHDTHFLAPSRACTCALETSRK